MSGLPLKLQLRYTPRKPGVYLMKNVDDGVLYVGKASNLKVRLSSYFSSSPTRDPKIRRMMSDLTSFEYIVTASAAEALILENTLIKKHKPPFNARLKDDKTYPYIKIDLNEDYPQVYITRRVRNDGSKYFGPFASAGSVRKTLGLLKKLFPYRSCTKTITGTDTRPCLEFYINRCAAPCTGAVDQQDYHKIIKQVILFMEGKTQHVLRDLHQKMTLSSDALQFERAGVLRDQIRAIQQVSTDRRIITESANDHDLDAIGIATVNDQSCLQVFFIRNGTLIGRESFVMEGTKDDMPERILAEFIKQFYQSASLIPKKLILPYLPEDSKEILEWLTKLKGGLVTLRVAKRGIDHRLLTLASENASQHLTRIQVEKWAATDTLNNAMSELQEELNLPDHPRTIECYDISNLQGSNAVGSMVTFTNGHPTPTRYRRFKIKTISSVDDYSMMQEMLRRRFRKFATIPGKGTGDGNTIQQLPTPDNKKQLVQAPNLVLIDGGKGHLSSALEVFLELGIDFIPLASIAKEHELLFVPQNPDPIWLPRNSPALHLVQRIRDEAHRFAITYHRKLRSKSAILSVIDSVEGIGPKRKKILLRQFGSLRGIKKASLDEIASIPGLTRSLAIKLKQTI